MEVFSLLKYWRTSAGSTTPTPSTTTIATPTTTTTTIRHVADETSEDDEEDDNNEDDGPFFDLEFTVPAEDIVDDVVEPECDVSDEESEVEVDLDVDDEEDEEFDFTVDSSGSTGNRTDQDPNLSFSPSDDLFFKGRFVPLEATELGDSQPKTTQFPSSLLKSATKLRVLMLGFKKPKSSLEKVIAAEPKQQNNKPSFTVKLKVEEVPIVSLFTRENSSRNTSNNRMKQQPPEEVIGSEEKKFTKDVLQKYLNMVKPLYFKVSRRNGGEKATGFSGHLSLNSTIPISSPTRKKIEGEMKEVEMNMKNQKEGNMNLNLNLNLTAGLRNVRKHLGKSRSASASVAAVNSSTGGIQSRRHDDSLLQQQDGIQSAILHCKRSFTASRDSDSSSGLSRCASDPSHEKSQPKSKCGDCSSRSSLDETRVKI